MTQTVLRIGELAAECGVSIDTIRYYERRSLLPNTGRSAGGFRLYTPEAVERLRFIKQVQETGLSLDEIGGLLSSSGAAECQKVRDLLRVKLDELHERIKAMKRLPARAEIHVRRCRPMRRRPEIESSIRRRDRRRVIREWALLPQDRIFGIDRG